MVQLWANGSLQSSVGSLEFVLMHSAVNPKEIPNLTGGS